MTVEDEFLFDLPELVEKYQSLIEKSKALTEYLERALNRVLRETDLITEIQSKHKDQVEELMNSIINTVRKERFMSVGSEETVKKLVQGLVMAFVVSLENNSIEIARDICQAVKASGKTAVQRKEPKELNCAFWNTGESGQTMLTRVDFLAFCTVYDMDVVLLDMTRTSNCDEELVESFFVDNMINIYLTLLGYNSYCGANQIGNSLIIHREGDGLEFIESNEDKYYEITGFELVTVLFTFNGQKFRIACCHKEENAAISETIGILEEFAANSDTCTITVGSLTSGKESALKGLKEHGFNDCLYPSWSTYINEDLQSAVDYIIVKDEDRINIRCHTPFKAYGKSAHCFMPFNIGTNINSAKSPCKKYYCNYCDIVSAAKSENK